MKVCLILSAIIVIGAGIGGIVLYQKIHDDEGRRDGGISSTISLVIPTSPHTETRESPVPTSTTLRSSVSSSRPSSMISQQQFKEAVLANGYPEPESEKYENLMKFSRDAVSSKRELAMFLAQILWESDGLRAKKEYRCEVNNCAGEYIHPPLDVPGKYYFGRGYIQLTWSYNYAGASKDLYGDKNILLDNPELVERDDVAWETALWFWKSRVRNNPGVLQGYFGASTNAINGGLECNGANPEKAKKRFEIYTKVLLEIDSTEIPNPIGCY